ncbi:MlaA family lipoprotein [Methylosarcina fibrata]|uniref:MlaA family lipoprotein n=1 Tax=Methylosarcina fibrata TaxID=105972 RepID=UPI00037B6D88|nr:VacJ family lipoprotein [Methylosarcina fibrata]
MIQQTTTIRTLLLSNVFALSALMGCASTTPPEAIGETDSLEDWNRGTYAFNDKLDKNVVKPLAQGYQKITPKPVNESITNFFSNINDIGVTVNDLLQLKLLQGGMDLSRFLVNTTVGVGGFFDVAKKINLPKHNEDFGQTLGFWGVPSGTYLVLPFFGPSSPRDTVGLVGDALLNPLTYVSVFGGAAVNAATAGSKVLEVTDTRSDVLSSEKVLDEAAVDRYEFIKNAYMQQRQYLVYDGDPPEEDVDELSLEEDGTGESSAAGPQTRVVEGGIPVTQGGYELGDQNPNNAPAPVINNSRHLLELSAPE